MCGIAGAINTTIQESAFRFLRHRGPDNQASYQYNNVELLHLRLAIIDLTDVANQPMHLNHLSIVFNGEIYNFLSVKEELQILGHSFKTNSDTEVLLVSIMEWGLDIALNKFDGMWAFALLNKQTNVLVLCRDKIGKKPLYVYNSNQKFMFASELKAFPKEFVCDVNPKSRIQFLSLGYVPGNECYYDNINKVEPGSYWSINLSTLAVSKNKYWRLPESNTSNHSYDEAIHNVGLLLNEAVRVRLISDVNFGCFLSGGIDSSLIAAIAQKQSSKKIKTFAIGFNEAKYDESIYAKKVANVIGSEHYEYKFDTKDLYEMIDECQYYFDEPFGDSSALPTLIVSKMAKKYATVALSGDGGDEMFLGYERYFFARKYFNLFKKIPPFARNIVAAGLKRSNKDQLIKMGHALNNFSLESILSNMYLAIKPWELRQYFNTDYVNTYINQEDIFYDLLQLNKKEIDCKNVLSKVNRIDLFRNLPDDMLTKVDRASMRYSLEVRSPLLSSNIMEYAISLKESVKTKNGPKSILKELVYQHIPKTIMDRPKMGFAIPIKKWISEELSQQLEDKINSLDTSIYNKNEILNRLAIHKNGTRNYASFFWNLLMLK
jgi:asparagine synthase (glutamine-hydrolysing)